MKLAGATGAEIWRTTVKGHNSEARVFSELGRVDTFWLDR